MKHVLWQDPPSRHLRATGSASPTPTLWLQAYVRCPPGDDKLVVSVTLGTKTCNLNRWVTGQGERERGLAHSSRSGSGRRRRQAAWQYACCTCRPCCEGARVWHGSGGCMLTFEGLVNGQGSTRLGVAFAAAVRARVHAPSVQGRPLPHGSSRVRTALCQCHTARRTQNGTAMHLNRPVPALHPQRAGMPQARVVYPRRCNYYRRCLQAHRRAPGESTGAPGQEPHGEACEWVTCLPALLLLLWHVTPLLRDPASCRGGTVCTSLLRSATSLSTHARRGHCCLNQRWCRRARGRQRCCRQRLRLRYRSRA